MNPESFLLSIAEISLAIVGFSAIVAGLARSRGEKEPAYQGLMINVLVEFGFAALLFALLPFIVAFFGVNDVWISRLCNSALAAFIFAYFPVYQRRRAMAIERDTRPSRQRNFYLRLIITYGIGIAALTSGWGLIPIPAFASYALGICWLLFLSAFGFLITIRQARQ